MSISKFSRLRAWVGVGLILLLPVVSCTGASADLSQLDNDALYGNWSNWVPANGGSQCTANISSGDDSAVSNIDYAGDPILSAAQLKAIADNTPTYQKAAKEADIPWQMLAAIHYRETGLKLYNPSNGQGIYQNTSGGFTPGEHITPAIFLDQSITAAKFIKNSVSSNYPKDQALTASTTDTDTIKDTFFTYNGRAGVYADQAASLGFNSSTQGFEGSPYVMNYADKKRDPTVNTTGWGQIKTDGGGISYPANSGQFGAFLVYADVAGLAITTNCGGESVSCSGPSTSAGLSSVRQSVVCLAEQELAAWGPSGTYKAGHGDYKKYSQGRAEEWCADFASWIYAQANDPLTTKNSGNVSYVGDIQTIGEDGKSFSFHPIGTYTPQPGDLAIHGTGHVNIVISVSGGKVTLIGGDQGGGSSGFENKVVNQYTVTDPKADDPPITGYVSPN